MSAAVAQRGPREHYAVARALHSKGLLSALVTDWYAPSSKLSKLALSFLGSAGQRMLAAEAHDLPPLLIKHSRTKTLFERILERGDSGSYDRYLKSDAQFASHSARLLAKDTTRFSVVFAYSYAALELLEFAKKGGKQSILLQIDPGPKEFLLVDEEARRWPSYAPKPPKFPSEYYARLSREWDLADRIIVNSDWTARAIVEHGAAPEKIRIVPLCYEAPSSLSHPRTLDAPLRVLFLGQINIRKGIQYLIEAASRLQYLPVEFVVAGHIQIPIEVIQNAPLNIKWLGAVPRSEVGSLYANSDLFILPTISDGFAITQIEAMSFGIPLISTPNCGAVVIEGETGFLIPSHSADAIVDILSSIYADRAQLSKMRQACLAHSKNFGLSKLATRLEGIIEELNG